MNPDDRPLNLTKYERGDAVTHWRYGGVYRVVRKRWRSELLMLLDLATEKEVIVHPKWLDPITNPLLVLAIQAT
jgi:hypothetical protein